MLPTEVQTLRKWPNPSSWEMRGEEQLSAKQRVLFAHRSLLPPLIFLECAVESRYESSDF